MKKLIALSLLASSAAFAQVPSPTVAPVAATATVIQKAAPATPVAKKHAHKKHHRHGHKHAHKAKTAK